MLRILQAQKKHIPGRTLSLAQVCTYLQSQAVCIHSTDFKEAVVGLFQLYLVYSMPVRRLLCVCTSYSDLHNYQVYTSGAKLINCQLPCTPEVDEVHGINRPPKLCTWSRTGHTKFVGRCSQAKISVSTRSCAGQAYLNDWHMVPEFIPEIEDMPSLLLQGQRLCADEAIHRRAPHTTA